MTDEDDRRLGPSYAEIYTIGGRGEGTRVLFGTVRGLGTRRLRVLEVRFTSLLVTEELGGSERGDCLGTWSLRWGLLVFVVL